MRVHHGVPKTERRRPEVGQNMVRLRQEKGSVPAQTLRSLQLEAGSGGRRQSKQWCLDGLECQPGLSFNRAAYLSSVLRFVDLVATNISHHFNDLPRHPARGKYE